MLWLLGLITASILVGYEYLERKKGINLMESNEEIHVDERHEECKGDTIFVVFPCYRHENAHFLLANLFESAYCATRISVGILEHDHTPGRPDVAQRYATLIHGTNAPNFLSRIRSKKAPISSIYGGSVARQEIINRFYSGEKYILFVHSHSYLLENWDKTLIQSLHKTYNQGGHLISMCPYEKNDDSNLQFIKDLPATFPVFSKFENHVPIFKGRFYTDVTTPCFQTGLASFKCLFGTSEILLDALEIHQPGIPLLQSDMADFLLSLKIWSCGYKIFTPTTSPLFHIPAHYHSFRDVESKGLIKIRNDILAYFLLGDNSVTKKKLLYIEKYLDSSKVEPLAFSKWIGIDTKKDYISGRLALGLLSNHSTEEIKHKYGSIYNFNRFKTKMCYETK